MLKNVEVIVSYNATMDDNDAAAAATTTIMALYCHRYLRHCLPIRQANCNTMVRINTSSTTYGPVKDNNISH